jgi:hypothetical protein
MRLKNWLDRCDLNAVRQLIKRLLMSKINRMPVFMIEKIKNEKAAFGREIIAAVMLKFLLLAGLWWFFFKDHKQPVDGNLIAAKLFNGVTAVNQQQKPRRDLNDYQ